MYRRGLTIALLGLSEVTAFCTAATALDQVLLIPCAWSCLSICNKLKGLDHREGLGQQFDSHPNLLTAAMRLTEGCSMDAPGPAHCWPAWRHCCSRTVRQRVRLRGRWLQTSLLRRLQECVTSLSVWNCWPRGWSRAGRDIRAVSQHGETIVDAPTGGVTPLRQHDRWS